MFFCLLAKKTFSLYFFFLCLFFVSGIFFYSGTEEPSYWSVKSTEQVASDYIKTHPEYSEFSKLVEVTGLHSFLAIRGPYTIMLPDNDAMFAYYKEKGVNSIGDFDEAFLRQLVLNHLVCNEIKTDDMGLGALRDTNSIGDYLVTEFEGSDIILNRRAKITDRDILLANGIGHRIDQVIEPVTKDIYAIISEDPSLQIFSEALEAAGLKDTLKKITFPYGQYTSRNRYTVLAVPDSIYRENGINSVDDLIKWTGTNPDSIKFRNSEFYRYMEYHCLAGTTYLSGLVSKLYPTMSNEGYVIIAVDTDYKINPNPINKKYTGFVVSASNTPAKNGALHIVNGLLPVSEPQPQSILFETTDFLEIKQGDWFGKYYMKWNDGKNDIAKIKFDGDFLGYYYKTHDCPIAIGRDALFMLGFWWVEITFPKVIKGKYKIIFGSPWTGTASFNTYVDGQLSPYWYDGVKGGNQTVGIYTFNKTAEHKIKIVPTIYGALYWDYIEFVPED